jgi:hypothetical protein
MLPMVCTSIALDYLEKRGTVIQKYLEEAGNCVLPSIVQSITLVDGDTFDPRNAIRQGEGAGTKLTQRLYKMNHSMARLTYLRNMSITGYNEYITPANSEKIIPVKVDPSEAVPENYTEFCNIAKNNARIYRDWFNTEDVPVIFLAVDNVKTRYEISKYAELFKNVLVINGGNEKTTGHVTIYERRSYQALDPNIYEIFDNIRPDVDKRPDEISCTTVSPKHDQIAITNNWIALAMMEFFRHWANSGTLDDFPEKGGRQVRRNEAILDAPALKMAPLTHRLIPQEANRQ